MTFNLSHADVIPIQSCQISSQEMLVYSVKKHLYKGSLPTIVLNTKRRINMSFVIIDKMHAAVSMNFFLIPNFGNQQQYLTSAGNKSFLRSAPLN